MINSTQIILISDLGPMAGTHPANAGDLQQAGGGAELNAALAEGGGTFCLDPDLEAKCDSRAVTTRSRCVSGAAVSLSSAETLFPLQEEKPRIVFCQGKTRVVLILAGVTEIRKVGKSQASELSKYRGQEDVHITHRSLLIFSTSGRL
ncbi:hypothetical protein HispidOSU_000339 [Sigmodon hispidus]